MARRESKKGKKVWVLFLLFLLSGNAKNFLKWTSDRRNHKILINSTSWGILGWLIKFLLIWFSSVSGLSTSTGAKMSREKHCSQLFQSFQHQPKLVWAERNNSSWKDKTGLELCHLTCLRLKPYTFTNISRTEWANGMYFAQLDRVS